MRILLEGRPGAGKTTALRRLAALLPAHSASGFATEEILQSGNRVGFALETLAGRREVLGVRRRGRGRRRPGCRRRRSCPRRASCPRSRAAGRRLRGRAGLRGPS
ncbi:nucleoside-triphosphatase [Streptomyces sp. NRRL S-448]|uniref:nucleoside-triphosphatase n=1 Tax=Streptomyces sp. NRRL S-448 TaxID=1463907 RepID=UPI003564AAE9